MSQLAFVFPGQGSQSVGMVDDLAAEFPLVKALYAQASQVLGYDLWQIVSEDSDDQLNATEYTQPALLVAGVAAWQVWQQLSESKPSMFAGHSLGEYTALVCAGVLDFTGAVTLVSKRGQFMQQAVPEGSGAMAAIIGMKDDDVAALCHEIDGMVEPANFNSVGQVVIAGEREAVLKAVEQAKPKGAKMAVQIPVSVPSHCELMKPAAEKLEQALSDITLNSPQIPVINNVDVAIEQDAGAIKAALVKQLYSPVRWVETIHKMQASGVVAIGECGPGKVLSGLIKRIDKQLLAKPLGQVQTMRDFIEESSSC